MRLYARIDLAILTGLFVAITNLAAQEYTSPEYNFKITFPDGSVDHEISPDVKKSGVFIVKIAPSHLMYEVGYNRVHPVFIGETPQQRRKNFEKTITEKLGDKILTDSMVNFQHTRVQSFLKQRSDGQWVYQIVYCPHQGYVYYQLQIGTRIKEDPSVYPEVQAFLNSFSLLVDDSASSDSTADSNAAEPPTPKDFPFPDQHCHLQVMSDWFIQPYEGFVLYGQNSDRKQTVGLQVAPMDYDANINDPVYVEKWKGAFTQSGYTFFNQAIKTINGTPVLYTEGQRKTGDTTRSFAMIFALANNQSYVLRVGVDGTDLPGTDLQDILNSFHIDQPDTSTASH